MEREHFGGIPSRTAGADWRNTTETETTRPRREMKDIKLHHAEIERLFAERAPVIVEVTSSATLGSSDWYLLEAAAAFWGIVANSKPGTEFYLLSVYSLGQVRADYGGIKGE